MSKISIIRHPEHRDLFGSYQKWPNENFPELPWRAYDVEGFEDFFETEDEAQRWIMDSISHFIKHGPSSLQVDPEQAHWNAVATSSERFNY